MEDSNPRPTRRRLHEQSWRAVLERFVGAATTVEEFCRCEGFGATDRRIGQTMTKRESTPAYKKPHNPS
ncbi:MAG: hypothetical protein U5L05_11020 [Rubrivivax sp.]|nr:hypothetical protein [Rubrivivax sp.]